MGAAQPIQTGATKRGTLAAILEGEHARVQTLLEQLLSAADANVQPALATTWGEIEALLLQHLEEEELYLFPDLARTAPAAVGTLEQDHARIRRLVAETGIAIELHTSRADVLHRLADELLAHAAREDELLHPWAETASAPGPRAFAARKRRML